MKSVKSFICFFTIVTLLFFCGCGESTELTEFEENMTTFKDNISGISDTMDAIDPESDSAVFELLSCLDSMNNEFQFLADMTVPSKFASIESLADEAYSYMNEANSLYHEYYDENSNQDENTKDAAQQNYVRAMKRITYISELLQGKIPEDSEISVTEEDLLDFEPVTEE